MLTRDEAHARVARGAAQLDAVRPGWFTEIDVGTLTLCNPCQCVVGQLTDPFDFMRGLSELCRIRLSNLGGLVFASRHYGFDIESGTREDYALLQDAWLEAIADRRLNTLEGLQRAHDGSTDGADAWSPDRELLTRS